MDIPLVHLFKVIYTLCIEGQLPVELWICNQLKLRHPVITSDVNVPIKKFMKSEMFKQLKNTHFWYFFRVKAALITIGEMKVV